MFEFILVVYITKHSAPEYVGNFESCTHANVYVEKHYKNVHYTTCLHENYIYLPKDLIRRNIKTEIRLD